MASQPAVPRQCAMHSLRVLTWMASSGAVASEEGRVAP